MLPMLTKRLLPSLFLVLLVAACGPGTLFDQARPAAGCPIVGVLDDAAEITRFQPNSGMTPTDLVFAAQFARVGRTCYFDSKEAQIDLMLEVVARRGPANPSAEAELDYFVVVLDPADNVVMRQPFKVLVKFQDRETRLTFLEQFGVLIDLGESLPSDFRVYVAFEMTPEELAYNRQKMGR